MGKVQIEYAKRLPAEKAGESEVFVHSTLQNISYKGETLAASFLETVDKFGDRPFLGTRAKLSNGDRGNYEWKTYREVLQNVRNLGSGILNEDLVPEINEEFPVRFVGVHSKNREEYVTLIQACILNSLTTVPLYDTLGPDVIEYILSHTHMTTIFGTEDTLNAIFNLAKEKKNDQLKNVVVFDAVSDDLRGEAAKVGLKVYSYRDLLASGQKQPQEGKKPKSEDVYYISYTSGTTGTPKAAMITHRNMFNEVMLAREVLPINSADTTISYLPLAHIAETTILQAFIRGGGSLGFYSGDPRIIKEDLAALKPTFFPGVPRIYNRFYDLIQTQFRSAKGLKKKLIDSAVAAKIKKFSATGSTKHGLWDCLVFKKVRAVLGGRVRTMFTSAAPINGEVLRFLKICFSANFIEIYGQTENTGGATVTHPQDPLIGHIGGVGPTIAAKLVDIPDMNYFATDKDSNGSLLPRGELCLKGSIVFKGYYKDPLKTKEAIDEDGWLHTGDIASVDSTGRIRIIDRKKAIFKLSQGEYVAPEKIENVYVTSRFVAQSWVYGDSLRDHTVGVVVPNEDVLKQEAKEKLGVDEEFSSLIQRDDVKNLVLDDLKNVGKSSGLKGFEGVKSIYLDSEAFTPENGLLTPTFKMKRNDAKQKYMPVISELYDQ
eukprot:CAMPEP_0115008730 /NCGR_PEP_ID=MMETSP0216-20121206/22122_1 /TAXON_ID=223996 /ORGANISM="Protocruzia adherens, Strain Boccale" /LENGTH=657 /DNA_ID=CAMNT_0002376265 /DNA_START=157 /DNA_END=2130 /DNA_ORIENTATION=+